MSTFWTVRALSVPGLDTDLSLFVAFDNARFLFGAGEGTQRAFTQKRLSMRGLQAVFLPNGGLRGRGGLPGILMTAADAGIKKLHVAGPQDTTQYISTLRASVVRDALSVEACPFPRKSDGDSQIVFSSPHLTVHAVALRPEAPETLVSSSHASSPRPRPTQLQTEDLDNWTRSIVADMFRGGSAPTHSGPLYPGMHRPAVADDRYPLPPVSHSDVATDMVYICRTPDVRGKFDVNRAKELNVPNGPIRGRLTKGETIEVDDPSSAGGKRLVRPEDCLVGGGPGSVLIVVNCSYYNLSNLLGSKAFDIYQGQPGTKPDVPVHCIVHHVSRTVWDDPRYQDWLSLFGSSTNHLLAQTEGPEQVFFNSSTWNATQLNLLDPQIFPIPHHIVSPTDPPYLSPRSSQLQPNHLVRMHPPALPEIMENHEKDRQFPIDSNGAAEAQAWVRANQPEYAAAAATARQIVAQKENIRDDTTRVPGDDIVITTLGTGSAIPSKYRNVSSTHLDIPGVGGILLDAGEGTLGQLRRRYGPAGLERVYSELRLIFISHMHADHHLGLSALLADRLKYPVRRPIYLVAPHAIALQLQETAAWQAGVDRSTLANIRFININRLKRGWKPSTGRSHETVPHNNGVGGTWEAEQEHLRTARSRSASPDRAPTGPNLEQNIADDVAQGRCMWPFENVFRFHRDTNVRANATILAMLQDLGLSEIITPPMPHRGAAYGLVLSHSSGWKVSYSGDTKPCSSFIEAGQGSTILIHEATLEDDKPEVAEAKGHSTFGQAIDVGRRMGARYIILNHFSQRYPKIPKLPAAGAALPGIPAATEEGSPALHVTTQVCEPPLQSAIPEPAIAISFDFMSLRAADTWKMAEYMDALSLLYAEDDEDDMVDDCGGETQPTGSQPPRSVGKGGKQGKAPSSQSTKSTTKGARLPGDPAVPYGRGSKRHSDPSVDVSGPKRIRCQAASEEDVQ